MAPFLNVIGLLAGSCVLAGCIGGTTGADFGKAAAVDCGVVTEVHANGQDVFGRLQSAVPVDGSYDLTVIATDTGGNMTTIRQGGAFVAPGGEPMPLGSVRLGPVRDVAATLVVTLGRGDVLACGH